MPMELLVHGRLCATKRSDQGCTCNPQRFTSAEAREAVAAHEGDSSRLEIVTVTAPPPNPIPDPVPPERSQARRHLRIISN